MVLVCWISNSKYINQKQCKRYSLHTTLSCFYRKKCQIVTNLIMLVASLFMAFCKMAKSFEMILIGRFLYGMGTGMTSVYIKRESPWCPSIVSFHYNSFRIILYDPTSILGMSQKTLIHNSWSKVQGVEMSSGKSLG